MIDLRKKALPNTIMVGGRAFSIYTDFRLWLRYEIEASRLKKGETIDVSYLFKNEMPERISLQELSVFANPPAILPRHIDSANDDIMLDFEIDADLIYAAFMGQYGIDLLEVDMHWHKFLALLSGVNDSTRLREIMGYRAYDKNQKGDQYEKQKKAWRIERVIEDDPEEAERFESLFK